MSYLCSTGVYTPSHTITQDEVKDLVQNIFLATDKQLTRLMPVFDHAMVEARQFVVDKHWFKDAHHFEERNKLYQEHALTCSLGAIDNCLTNQTFLKEDIPYEAIDLIVFVSSTGLATPSMDVHIMNERPFREDVQRMPLWGLGCAGGAIGLSRAHNWIQANPTKTALIVCCELCSLTFQKGDMKKSNIVGTALFGDGIGASLLVGEASPHLNKRNGIVPKITETDSLTKRNSTDVMGWAVTDGGLEVIFSKSIPALVSSFWKDHAERFFHTYELSEADVHSFIAHPGGKKVLEAMEEVLHTSKDKVKHSYEILKSHGNMSSATVLYVLQEWMKEQPNKGEKSVLSALGPGFSSELLLLEWV